MTKSFSIYLDFLRFFASFLVLLFHSRAIYNPHLTIFSFGHEAVIIFFVLSGFVIAFVADTKEITLKLYASSRFARIYSVAVPAIIITAALDFFGYRLDPISYDLGVQAWDYPYIRLLSSILFTNEIWNNSIQLFSNVPYWSLNYEVWYYVGFAALTFVKDKSRWVLFACCCLFTGPKILLLMPIWWMGVYLYKTERFNNISLLSSTVLMIISILGIYAYIRYSIGSWGWNYLENIMGAESHRKYLAFSRQFISDYFLGIVIATHFIAVRGLCNKFENVFNKIERPIRIIAGSTFTLYLLHQPLLHFYKSIMNKETMGLKVYITILMFTIITTFLISLITEQKKYIWKKWIVTIFDLLEKNISERYGTFKGFIRLTLSNIKFMLGFFRKYHKLNYHHIKRLVFVCHGNICRSPFGHYLALEKKLSIPVCSIGLLTTTGNAAYDMAVDVAQDFNIDLSQHKATNITNFEIKEGDLFLVMEDRHIPLLAPYIKGKDVQVGLLGLWCRPIFPLLYDPHRLSRKYFVSCFTRIKSATERLTNNFENKTNHNSKTNVL